VRRDLGFNLSNFLKEGFRVRKRGASKFGDIFLRWIRFYKHWELGIKILRHKESVKSMLKWTVSKNSIIN